MIRRLQQKNSGFTLIELMSPVGDLIYAMRAVGNLDADADADESLFEMSVGVGENNVLYRNPDVHTQDELE